MTMRTMTMRAKIVTTAREIERAIGWAATFMPSRLAADELALLRLTRERDELVAVIERGALAVEEIEAERDAAAARTEKAIEEMHGEHQCRVRSETEAGFLRADVERLTKERDAALFAAGTARFDQAKQRAAAMTAGQATTRAMALELAAAACREVAKGSASELEARGAKDCEAAILAMAASLTSEGE